jgi:hypothetical protein
MPAKKSLSELNLDIKSMYNGEYSYYSGEYTNQKSKIKIQHKNGKIIETTFKSFREGKNLLYNVKKHSTKRISVEDYKKRLKNLNPSIIYLDPENFKGRKFPGKFKCSECSNEWEIKRVEQLIDSNELKRTGCPVCSNQNRGKYLRDKNYLKNILKEASDGYEYK